VVNYEVTIKISSDAQLLKPDMTANVTVRTAQHSALVLPSEAVQQDGEQNCVYVSGPNGPQRRLVIVGTRYQSGIEIKKGVTAGDNVLIAVAGSSIVRGKNQ
jgi:hypothetical protein